MEENWGKLMEIEPTEAAIDPVFAYENRNSKPEDKPGPLVWLIRLLHNLSSIEKFEDEDWLTEGNSSVVDLQ